MPICTVDDVDLHYETEGEGFPLFFISGLGGGAWTWYGQVPFFSRHYRTIAFDNRGAGRSSMPPGPYSMRQMARDALGLLDRLDIRQAFVFSLSMGGMIALEMALLAPERVRALLLGCTHAGGPARISPGREVMETVANFSGLSPEEVIRRNIPIFFSRKCRDEKPEIIEEYCGVQLEFALQPEHAFFAQLAAIHSFDCSARLAEIETPALVVTGTEDVLVSPENSRNLARALPNAELAEIRGSGHALHVESRDILNDLAHRFFMKHLPQNAAR